jgi:hypothetical protein
LSRRDEFCGQSALAKTREWLCETNKGVADPVEESPRKPMAVWV